MHGASMTPPSRRRVSGPSARSSSAKRLRRSPARMPSMVLSSLLSSAPALYGVKSARTCGLVAPTMEDVACVSCRHRPIGRMTEPIERLDTLLGLVMRSVKLHPDARAASECMCREATSRYRLVVRLREVIPANASSSIPCGLPGGRNYVVKISLFRDSPRSLLLARPRELASAPRSDMILDISSMFR